ncbi:MAG: rhodanese-like domain-containing protein [Deltaproteobacteria bacterium]|nr:MAG: rhodanese-like domain-containing protein [Deltaproteobacteria bacterium]
MGKLAVILGALGLVSGAFGEESASTTGTPQGGADARKNLADFFLRTKGMTRVVSASEVSEAIRTGKSKYRVVDVRPAEEYEKGHLPGAINLPLDVLFRPASLEKLPATGDPILLVCHSGHMESMALGGLAALGYEPYVLRFGMIGWNAETKVKVAGSPGQSPEVVRGLGGPIEK